LKREENYEHGVLEGLFRAWHENGQVWQEGSCHDGKETPIR
jgi:antitoxin component YwqK of YwqJK toxin-antitoxin module